VARSVVFWYFGRYGSGILVFWVICEWYFGLLAVPKYRRGGLNNKAWSDFGAQISYEPHGYVHGKIGGYIGALTGSVILLPPA
jgi:hypothetical protein